MTEYPQLGVGQQIPPQLAQQLSQPLAPQGFFGSLIGAPLGGLIGRGIGGLLGNSQLGNQIGQFAGGIGGGFLPLSADPYQQQQQQQLQQQQLQQLQQLQQQAQMAQLAQAGQQGQLAPQGWFGNALSAIGKPLGGFIGGLAGNQGLGQTIGGIASQFGGLLPFGADSSPQQAAAMMAQSQPQGGYGGLSQFFKPTLGSVMSDYIPPRHLGGIFGAGPYGGFVPFPLDPRQLQAMQQAQQGQPGQPAQAGQQAGQIAPQGWFGDALSSFGKPLGGLIGSLAGNQQLGNTIGGIASQFGGLLPFSADPYQQALQQAQQAQLAQANGQLSSQGWFGDALASFGKPLGGLIGGLAGNQQLGNTIGGIASQFGGLLPFSADPYQQQALQQAQQAQQAQLAQLAQQGQQGGQIAPQGWFGDALASFGKPLGGLIGGLAGNQQLGNTIGGIASQFGGLLPFSADPYQQQRQQQQQQQLQQQLQQLQQQQLQQQLLQQQLQGAGAQGQLAPQGWFGNALASFGKPLGGLIGGLAGNQQLGNTIGGIASQFGGLLPFTADPYAAYLQQVQQGQPNVQQLQPGQYPVYQAYGGGQAGQGYGVSQGGQQGMPTTLH